MKILKDLMMQTHQNILFNSTVFACQNYVPFCNKLGGDCLDQIYYLYSIAINHGLKSSIVSFDKEDNKIFHAALVIDNYYVDPNICLVEPILMDNRWKEIIITGYDKISFKVQKKGSNIDLFIKTSKGIDKRTSVRNISIEDLFYKQLSKTVERMSAVMINKHHGKNVSIFKIKEFENSHWYIKDGKSVVSEGTTPDTILRAFAKEASVNQKSFITNWRLARKILYENKNNRK